MLDRLLPQRIDSTYHGPRLASWLLGFLLGLLAVILVGLGVSLRRRPS